MNLGDNSNLPPSIPTNLQSSVFQTKNLIHQISKSQTIKHKFECFHCGVFFKRNDHLKRHEMIHRKKKFCCNKCERKFTRLDQYKNHLKIHLDEHSFFCLYQNCEKKFKNKASLDYHTLKHESPKIRCNFPGCKKTFYRMNELLRHKKNKKCHLKALFNDGNDNSKNNKSEIYSDIIYEIFESKNMTNE